MLACDRLVIIFAAASSVVGGNQEYIDRDRLCFNVAL